MCEHAWRSGGTITRDERRDHDGRHFGDTRGEEPTRAGIGTTITLGDTCTRCGAFYGHLGNEPTFQQYLSNLVTVFREAGRVLRDDGVLVCNLGDVFSSVGGDHSGRDDNQTGVGAKKVHANGGGDAGARKASRGTNIAQTKNPRCDFPEDAGHRSVYQGIPQKCKMLLPHRFAIAMIDDGWIVRQDCVWSKVSPLPESVTDRPTTAHEYVFIFTKQAKYYWDREAVLLPYAEATMKQLAQEYRGTTALGWEEAGAQSGSDTKRSVIASLERNDGANLRSVLMTAGELMVTGYVGTPSDDMTSVLRPSPQPFDAKSVGITSVSHFASYPVSLIEPFVRAAVPERCCPTCGTGWVREVEREAMQVTPSPARQDRIDSAEGRTATNGTMTRPPTSRTKGFRPGCDCPPAEPVPGVALDIFSGTGTTAVCALRNHRRAVLCEISADYVRIAEARLRPELGLFTDGGVEVERVAGEAAPVT